MHFIVVVVVVVVYFCYFFVRFFGSISIEVIGLEASKMLFKRSSAKNAIRVTFFNDH